MHEPALKFIKDYWFVILFIGGLVIGWTSFQNGLSQVEVRLAKVEVRSDADVVAIASINVQLAQIQTTLEFIKQQLSKK